VHTHVSTTMKFAPLTSSSSHTIVSFRYCPGLLTLEVVDCEALRSLNLAGCPALSSVRLSLPRGGDHPSPERSGTDDISGGGASVNGDVGGGRGIDVGADHSGLRVHTVALPRVTHLVLTTRALPSPEFVAGACPNLVTLEVHNVEAVEIDALRHLARLVPTLTRVVIAYATYTPTGDGGPVGSSGQLPPCFDRFDNASDGDPATSRVTLTLRDVRTRGTFELSLPSNATVGEFRNRISSRTGVPISSVSVVYAGRRLDNDDVTLGRAGVTDGATLNLVAATPVDLTHRDVITIDIAHGQHEK
jgi:hypothetical protein